MNDQPRRYPGWRTALLAVLLLSAGCSLFSQTPDPQRRKAIRAALPYGLPVETAESRLSGLGFACSRRQGNYLDEEGRTRSADHFLFCEQRPGRISFSCENRDQVTVLSREGLVSGIEVVHGPSCVRQ